MKKILLLGTLLLPMVSSLAQGTDPVETNISYLTGDAGVSADAYQRGQCTLDVYVPEGQTGFATVIFLHGGGLTGGKKTFPGLKGQGLGLVAVGYRLSPQADIPAFFEDTAAAVAWTLDNIASYGGDPDKVFLAGYSAGAYLAAMVGMDPQWLAPYGLSPDDLAGIICVSGQMSTHFRVKKLRGDSGPEFRVVVDEFAPLTYASKDLPPVCLIVGDRQVEYKNRVEENELMAVSLRNLGHTMTAFHELPGLTHGTVSAGAWKIVPDFIRQVTGDGQP